MALSAAPDTALAAAPAAALSTAPAAALAAAPAAALSAEIAAGPAAALGYVDGYGYNGCSRSGSLTFVAAVSGTAGVRTSIFWLQTVPV